MTPEQREAMLAAQRPHRPAEPDDMIDTAGFLLSDDAAYLTGQKVSVKAASCIAATSGHLTCQPIGS